MCSGKHRGLGVHLSFVRSITMDSWKDLELEKMRVSCLSCQLSIIVIYFDSVGINLFIVHYYFVA